jgi:hypothetical protein
MKNLFAVNKYLPVALALGALAAAGPAPAFAHKNSGLTAYARAAATDYYTVPSGLGSADRKRHSVKGPSLRLAQCSDMSGLSVANDTTPNPQVDLDRRRTFSPHVKPVPGGAAR